MPQTQVSLDDLADQITTLCGHINAANYRLLQLVAEFDRRSGWGGTGSKSCAHWLGWKCGIELGPAREKVRVARALEQLPRISDAFGKGEISYSVARAITRVATPATEEEYLYLSQWGTASQLEQLVRKHKRARKLQSSSQATVQQEEREATFYLDDDGMWVIKARLPAVEGELVVKALQAVMDREREELAACGVSDALPMDEVAHVNEPQCAEEYASTQKTFPQKRADAITTMAEHMLASGNSPLSDLKGAERCQVMLHVDVHTLQQRSQQQHCRLDNGNWIHPDTARRLSCDASVVTVLTDGNDKVLNIGRRSRLVPPSMRRALDIRDQGCRFPGCGCNRYVDAHHITHWADGGETRLDNLVTLCRFHHRQLHEGVFTLETGVDPVDDFRFIDGEGVEIRATVRPLFPGQQNMTRSPARLRVESFGKNVSAETCVTKWQGEAMDEGWVIGGLLDREFGVLERPR